MCTTQKPAITPAEKDLLQKYETVLALCARYRQKITRLREVVAEHAGEEFLDPDTEARR
jgi:hypothetical protein